MLALDVDVPREGLLAPLGPQRRRLEFLDYPGEWLLDLPLLSQDFAAWSEATLRRLEGGQSAGIARAFLGFVRGLPAGVVADEALTLSGHRLYTEILHRMRDEAKLAFLQPGRFLMPPPGPPPPWTQFFPLPGQSPLAKLMRERFNAYVDAVRRDLMSPMFGDLDGLVVLADLLSALHQGQSSFADAQSSLAAAADALRWDRSWTDWLASFARFELPPSSIGRVAFVATKADHIASRQRGNLAALVRRVTRVPEGNATSAAFAIASVRCTEDVVETLAGRPVSAVRGRIIGEPRPARFYPGEVPDGLPDDAFWQHRFLALPDFEPMRARRQTGWLRIASPGMLPNSGWLPHLICSPRVHLLGEGKDGTFEHAHASRTGSGGEPSVLGCEPTRTWADSGRADVADGLASQTCGTAAAGWRRQGSTR